MPLILRGIFVCIAMINIYTADVSISLKNRTDIKEWITSIIRKEGHKLEQLNYIFCSDTYLLEINEQYLKHDDYTDIITFDLSDKKGVVNGEIYISYERIKENAAKYLQTIKNESHRIMVHGALHLLGYKDKTAKEKTEMTQKEDFYLNLRKF